MQLAESIQRTEKRHCPLLPVPKSSNMTKGLKKVKLNLVAAQHCNIEMLPIPSKPSVPGSVTAAPMLAISPAGLAPSDASTLLLALLIKG